MNWQFETTQLTDEQYRKWSELLELRTGMTLLPHLRSHVQTQLSMRMRERECSDVDKYFQLIGSGLQGAAEWRILLDRLMVKETSFFRHQSSYELLQGFLDERLAEQDSVDGLSDTVDVWSLGCSTGEEVYSLVFALTECFKQMGIAPYYSVTGTDISLPALATARKGVYRKSRLAEFTPEQQEKYFEPQDEDKLQVRKDLRGRTCFNQGNIKELSRLPDVQMDVIFCQNVLIYFRRWRRREILDQLVRRLKPGGLLIIGPGEITEWQNKFVRPLNKNNTQAYQKVSERPEGN
ncbi:MAG: methyltransferase domain-containing protein [Cellvibrionaceae bacterium]